MDSIPPKKNKRAAKEHPNLEKLERRHLLDQQKLIKPGECLKYLKTFIDPEILNGNHGVLVLSNLSEFKVHYEIKTQIIPGVIRWEREVQAIFEKCNSNVQLTNRFEEQNQILLLIQGSEIVNLIKTNELSKRIQNISEIFPNKSLTLLIFGLREYLRTNKNMLARKEIEIKLTELQIFNKCNHRLLETAAEFALTIAQFSKAIAEEPYKKKQAEKFEHENFYLMNDNRDCVRVQNTQGLARLWQQHLIKLPLVTLETAQSIINEYPLPRKLLDAYDREADTTTVNDGGSNLLSDIPVRRAGGPLTSVRRIGPELSRKIHLLYTTNDPNQIIG